ncbi:MAG: hypothetical protein JO139_01775 [Alphaproteobacteria bacterium]|nr:hypothetical protein [Alphaproteobacteria bacterium]
MIFEDAHWIDPTSRELLDLTVERVRSLPVLLIVTFRPEFQPSWSGEPHVTTLVLKRLDRHSLSALVEQIAGPKALPSAVVDLNFDHSIVRRAGLYPQAASQAFLAIVLFCLGYPVQVSERSNAAITEARRLAHLPSLAVSLTNGARPLSFTGNHAALEECASHLVSVETEQSFLLWRAMGTIYRGWIKANNGHGGEGISLMRQRATAYRATGAMAFVPYQLGLLARACDIAGQVEEAADLLDDSLQIVEQAGERWLERSNIGTKATYCCVRGIPTPQRIIAKP